MQSTHIKKPNTMHPVNPLILKRWSARSFSEKPIAEEVLNTLFEAASWASSSMNEQPWEYWVVTTQNEEKYRLFWSCLMEGNQPWAQTAPVLILSLARKSFEKTGTINRHALYDCGAANANLLLQAADLDIYGHQMGGFYMDKTIQMLHVPDDLEPICFIALGYLDTPEKLEEPFRTRELTPRQRKSLENFVKKYV